MGSSFPSAVTRLAGTPAEVTAGGPLDGGDGAGVALSAGISRALAVSRGTGRANAVRRPTLVAGCGAPVKATQITAAGTIGATCLRTSPTRPDASKEV